MTRFRIFYTTGVYNLGTDEKHVAVLAKRLPQYAAAWTGINKIQNLFVLASIAAFGIGTTLAWTSPAAAQLLNGAAGFPINDYELSIIGSLMPIGAAVSCVPAGYLTDKIGRKITILTSVPLFLIGWCWIIWPICVEMIYAGRFVIGMCGGAICVTAPVYTAEISQKQIRGEMLSYFQLLMACGITLTYIIGSQLDVYHLSILCATVPIIFGTVFFFLPDTPTYYLIRGHLQKARKSLKFFRGMDYDVEPELYELQNSRESANKMKESKWDAFISKSSAKPLFMSVGMMVFQQMSGINALTFYTTIIFQDAGSSLEPKYATIIVGLMQFTGTFIAMFLIDRVGRVVLLGISAIMMSACTFIMGVHFSLKENNFDTTQFSWLPLLSLCIFTVMFAVGYGPVPWVMMPEIVPSKIKGTIISIACVMNWLCAFLVTKFYSELVEALGSQVTFWIFSVISLFGAIFSFKVLPETKGKSLDQIQTEMNN